jgi:hypothetical protein
LLYDVLQFVSQCFIVVVFWRLGLKKEEEEEIFELRIAPFDNEAEIQLMIWQ